MIFQGSIEANDFLISTMYFNFPLSDKVRQGKIIDTGGNMEGRIAVDIFIA